MSTTVVPLNPEENLEWERAQAPRAGLAAILAGLLGVLGVILSGFVLKDLPHQALLTDGLRDAAGQPVPGGGLLTPRNLALEDDKVLSLATGIVIALHSVLIAPALGYLYRAAVGRRPQTPTFALYAALIGPILLGVAQIVNAIAWFARIGDFASGTDRSTAAAYDALHGSVVDAGQLLVAVGTLVLAVGVVVIALNAMRVGLLSRFMGVLGIIIGVLTVLTTGSGLGTVGAGGSPQILQTFWLVAIGWLFLGRWPSGVPLAWQDGQAHPWPSQQELREQRERAARGESEPDGDDEPEPEPVPGPQSTPGRKKRKRRN